MNNNPVSSQSPGPPQTLRRNVSIYSKKDLKGMGSKYSFTEKEIAMIKRR
jgi:hypothetical protein